MRSLLVAILVKLYAAGVPRQIDPVSVLLPHTLLTVPGHRVNVTLQAYGGCYEWKVQREQVARVRDLTPSEKEEVTESTSNVRLAQTVPSAQLRGPDCHNEVVVAQYLPDTILATEKTWVFAEDVQTGSGMKCDVYVAPIHSFVIETTAKSVTVGGAETLRIRAFDRDGNVFTSLEGLRFQWELERPRILSVASLNNDVYRPTAVRKQIAEMGEQSDIILIKGVANGRSRVSVKILEPNYSHLAPAVVEFDVLEPVVAVPSSISVPPEAVLSLGIKVLRGKETPNQALLVQLPHLNFLWQADESSNATLDARKGTVKLGKEPGDIAVRVSDQRNMNNTDYSFIHVRKAESLGLLQAPLGLVDASFGNNVDLSRLEKLFRAQHEPVAVPATSESSLVRRIAGISGRPTSTEWLLPSEIPVLVATDLMAANSGSLYVPENCKIELKLSYTSAQAAADLLWESANGAAAVIVPKTVGTKGVIEIQQIGASGETLNFSQRFRVVEPVRIGSRKNKMRVFGPTSIETEAPEIKEKAPGLGTEPVLLPQNESVVLNIYGGSGVFVADSADESVCRVRVDSDKLEVVTGSLVGRTTITIRDQNHRTDFYRVHCVAAAVKSIHYEKSRNYIPLVKQPTKAVIPFYAEAQVSKEFRQLYSDFFAAGPTYFTNCRSLVRVTKHSLTHLEAASSVSIRLPTQHRKSQCGEIVIPSPKEPQVTTMNAYYGRVSTKPFASCIIEFFLPMTPVIPALDFLKDFSETLKPIRSTSAVSSQRLESSLVIAIGSSIDVQLAGGPQGAREFNTVITLKPEDKVFASIVNASGDLAPVGVPNSRLLLKVHCLDFVAAAEVTVEVSTLLQDNQKHTEKVSLTIGCSVPETIRVMPLDKQEVQLLPPQAAGIEDFWTWKALGRPRAGIPAVLTPTPIDASVFATAGQHKFRVAAWDNLGRPLLSISSFSPTITVYRSVEAKETMSVPAVKDEVSELKVEDRHYGESILLLGTVLTPTTLSNPLLDSKSILLLKNTLNTLPKRVSGDWKLVASSHNKEAASQMSLSRILQVANAPSISLEQGIPPILASRSWVYRTIVAHGSGHTSYQIYSLMTDKSDPSIKETPNVIGSFRRRGVYKNAMESLSEADDLISLSTLKEKMLDKIVELVDGRELQHLKDDAQWEELILKAPEAGLWELTARDRSMLGAQLVKTRIEVLDLHDISLTLYNADSKAVRVWSGSGVSELESEVWHKMELVVAGKEYKGKKVVKLPGSFTRQLDPTMIAMPPSVVYSLEPADRVLQMKSAVTGSAVVTAVLDTGKEKLSASLDVIFHKPLTVTPNKIVLLPHGSYFRPRVDGGGSRVTNCSLASSDVFTARIEGSGIAAENPSSSHAIVSVVDASNGTPLSTSRDSSRVEVTVARPSKLALLVGGEWQTSNQLTMQLSVQQTRKIVAGLMTANSNLFTHAALSDEQANSSYNCKYTWSSVNPGMVSFLTGDVLVPSISSSKDGMSVVIAALQVGVARISLSVECIDRRSWGSSTFTRWSNSIGLSIRVEGGESLIPIQELRSSVRHLYEPKGFLTMAPKTYSEPVRVLRDSQYELSISNIALSTPMELSLSCRSQTMDKISDRAECPGASAITSAVLENEKVLLHTGAVAGLESLLSIGVSEGMNVASLNPSFRFRTVLLANLRAVPVNLSKTTKTRRDNGPQAPEFGSVESSENRWTIKGGTKLRFSVLATDDGNHQILLPIDKDLEVVISRPDVADVKIEREAFVIEAGFPDDTTCVGVSVSLSSVLDVFPLCIEGNAVVREGSRIIEKPTPIDNETHSLALRARVSALPWTFVALVAATVVVLAHIAGNLLKKDIIRKDGEGLKRDWSRNVTPAHRSVSVFPSNSAMRSCENTGQTSEWRRRDRDGHLLDRMH